MLHEGSSHELTTESATLRLDSSFEKLTRFFQEARESLVRKAVAYFGDYSKAEEAIQNQFVKRAARIQSGVLRNQPAKLEAYVLRMAKNEAVDEWRKQNGVGSHPNAAIELELELTERIPYDYSPFAADEIQTMACIGVLKLKVARASQLKRSTNVKDA